MRLKKLVLALALASAFTVNAQSLDLSLGTGDWSSVSGQTLTGPQTFQAGPNAWAISPYTGSTMYSLQPTNPSNSYANMASALGMSSSSVTALSAEIAAQNPQGGGNITNAAWVSKNFTFTSAASFKMYWTYTSTDYVPFNDGSITTLVNTGDANTLGKINGVTTQYLLLGATNPGTGNYSTDSYGSTGWQVVNYDVLSAGTYKLGFGIFNQGDTALSPVLNVNDGLGTVTKNGTTFGAVAPNDPTMPTVNPTPTPPPAPTVVSQSVADSVSTSTSNGTSTVATSIAYAATTVAVAQSNAKGDQTPKVLNVVQTTVTTGTTPFVLTHTTTTPVTTTTVTTPITTKVWSDNTTTTEEGTPVTTTTVTDSVSSTNTQGVEVAEVQTQQNFTTRIDQYDQLQKQNSRLNASLDSDPLSRFKLTEDGFSQRTADERDWNFYVNVNGANSNTVDSYKFNSSTYGLGYEKKIDNETIIGGQFNRVSLRTTGEQGGGDLSKDAVGIYALKIIDNFLLKTDVGYSVNKYNTGHNLPELGLNNWSSANGNDKWIAIRAYFPEVPEFHNIRPYIGSRVEYNKRNATSDKGSEVSAVNYSALNSTTGIMEAGVRYEKPIDEKWTAIAEVGGNTAKLNTVSASAIYAADNNSSLIAKLVVQEQNGLTSNKLMIIGRINF